MAVTNLRYLNPSEKTLICPDLEGDGAPALTDELVQDVKKFPVGTKYYDKTNRIEYRRVAANKALADFSKSAAGTLHS